MLGCAKDGRVLRMSPWSEAHGHTDEYTLIQPPDAYVLGCRPALAETVVRDVSLALSLSLTLSHSLSHSLTLSHSVRGHSGVSETIFCIVEWITAAVHRQAHASAQGLRGGNIAFRCCSPRQ